MPRLYFDYNATTPLAPSVREKLKFLLKQDLKNPSSVHTEGRAAREAVDAARGQLASLLDCLPDEIVFTSGATESNNWVFKSIFQNRPPRRNRIVTTSVEHSAVWFPLQKLKNQGVELVVIPVSSEGVLDMDALNRAVDDSTLLVSVMLTNNETGMVFPVAEIASKIRGRGAYFHTDAACALGKMPVSFRKLGVDFLSFSGTKFYAPKGVGGLLVHHGLSLSPLISGGKQQRGLRAGTENVEGIVALSEGLNFSLQDIEKEILRLYELRLKICEGLRQMSPKCLFHEGQDQLPGTLNVSFPGLSGQVLLARLDLEGVAASYGSACQSGTLEVSRALLGMGISEEEAESSIRLSFGKMTTEQDVENLLGIFKKIL